MVVVGSTVFLFVVFISGCGSFGGPGHVVGVPNSVKCPSNVSLGQSKVYTASQILIVMSMIKKRTNLHLPGRRYPHKLKNTENIQMHFTCTNLNDLYEYPILQNGLYPANITANQAAQIGKFPGHDRVIADSNGNYCKVVTHELPTGGFLMGNSTFYPCWPWNSPTKY
jgi:hypothetical protein